MPQIILELEAVIGFKKHFHFGGWEATHRLIESCEIDESKTVLDVRSANGRKACYFV
jgi:hypothetical protein